MWVQRTPGPPTLRFAVKVCCQRENLELFFFLLFCGLSPPCGARDLAHLPHRANPHTIKLTVVIYSRIRSRHLTYWSFRLFLVRQL
ncbi:hypothetical protein AFLA_011310 [Aspergillus flavus NRRL3357]|nr:hypothetical protein AFLA_011310 [Aspergillus flavus NRRL3357]